MHSLAPAPAHVNSESSFPESTRALDASDVCDTLNALALRCELLEVPPIPVLRAPQIARAPSELPTRIPPGHLDSAQLNMLVELVASVVISQLDARAVAETRAAWAPMASSRVEFQSSGYPKLTVRAGKEAVSQ